MSKQTVSSKLKSITKTVFDLNISKFKKILFATGFLVLGVCTTAQSVDAMTLEKCDTWSQRGKTMVKIKVVQTEEEKAVYSFEDMVITASKGGEEVQLAISEKKINAEDGECIGIVELPDEETYTLTANISKDGGPDITANIAEVGGVVNISPKVTEGTLLKYSSPEYGDYIQAQFEANCKITKITDIDNVDRLVLKKKEQANKVTLKYILNENEKTFRIYNEEGNSTVVDISDAVEVTFNARTRDGSRFVLGVTEEIEKAGVTYKLSSIVTGAGQDIDYHSDNQMYGIKEAYDNEDADLNEIVGVTRLILTYKAANADDIVVKLPLILDKTYPEVVGYLATMDADGTYIVEKIKANVRKKVTENPTGVKLRAYVNNATDKCIVEVRDVQSGIDTIKLLKGSKDTYRLIEETAKDPEQRKIAKRAGYNSYGKLESSVLHLFSFAELKDKVTAVRITDGLGNEIDIEVAVSNMDKEDTIIHAELEEYPDDHGRIAYRVVAQDYKAGLWRIERDTADEDVKQVLVNFESPDADGIIVEEFDKNGVLTRVEDPEKIAKLLEIAGQNYKDAYEQYTLGRVVRNITQEGEPTIMVYDALGNARQVSFDDIAFACYYATYNQRGSLALSIKETRGVWKITAGLVSTEDNEREKACLYKYIKDGKMVTEVPVDANEPLYDGKIPCNGSKINPSEEFFLIDPDDNPGDYKEAEDNRPKYVTSDGKSQVPNNGLDNSNAYGEYFDTTGGGKPEEYHDYNDNRPKYEDGKVPQEGVNDPKYFDTDGVDKGVPTSENEPKYNNAVPSSINEPKYTKPNGQKVVASAENEPKYTFEGEANGSVPAYAENEPTVPAEGTEGYDEAKVAHDAWEATQAKVAALEAGDRVTYDKVVAEHKKWVAAKAAHDVWNKASQEHELWEAAMAEYIEWQDVLEDYNEWKSVLAEYKQWKIVNAEHIKWKNAYDAHKTWEDDSITTYTLEIFKENQEPSKLVKAYQVPDGIVKKVTVYYEHDKDDFYNEITTVEHKKVAPLQDVSELTAEEVIRTDAESIRLDEEKSKIIGANVVASRGIKLVEYVDKTVVEFNKELPTELFINCDGFNSDVDGLIVTVTDSVGFELKIYVDKVVYDEYENDEKPTKTIDKDDVIRAQTEQAGDDQQSGGSEPTGNEPGGSEPTGNEPGGSEPTGNEPGGSEPAGNDQQSGGSEPTGNEPTGNEP